MPAIRCLLVACLVLLPCGVATAQPDLAPYLHETPRISDVDASQTRELRAKLAREVQHVLDRGVLAPLCLSYGDIPGQALWVYTEPGRIITTLAGAYPHLPASMQPQVVSYVRAMLDDPREQPWRDELKQHDEGSRRELHGEVYPAELRWYPHLDEWPRLHTWYGLWLYGDRTGDWQTLRQHWPNIKRGYFQQAQLENLVLYGQLSGHIGMARLAERFGDSEARARMQPLLERDFGAAMDDPTIEERQKQTFFGVYHDLRQRDPPRTGYFDGQPWMFLNAAPEVMRFVGDHVREHALARIDAFTQRYPLWWVAQAPYFTRWTGDESVGLVTPEAMGMVMPFHRWLLETQPQQQLRFLRSSPTGYGDAFWIDAAVAAIESTGTTRWQPLD